MINVLITIQFKEDVLDPEGKAIAASLHNLGYSEVGAVMTGRLIRLTLDESDASRALQKAAKMCEVLLVNTIIETYDITIEDGEENSA